MSIITDGIAPISEDNRLDTGMKVEEAMKRAEIWWEHTGKKMIGNAVFMKKGFVSLDDPENNVPSGIMKGHDWNALEKREKLMVVKVWHHFKIRRPDALGIDPNDKFLMGKKNGV